MGDKKHIYTNPNLPELFKEFKQYLLADTFNTDELYTMDLDKLKNSKQDKLTPREQQYSITILKGYWFIEAFANEVISRHISLARNRYTRISDCSSASGYFILYTWELKGGIHFTFSISKVLSYLSYDMSLGDENSETIVKENVLPILHSTVIESILLHVDHFFDRNNLS